MNIQKYEFLMNKMDSFQLDFLLALKELGGYNCCHGGVFIKCKIRERRNRKVIGSSKPYYEYWTETSCSSNEYHKIGQLHREGILNRLKPWTQTIGYVICADVYEDFLNMLEERREIRVFNRLEPILEKGYKI